MDTFLYFIMITAFVVLCASFVNCELKVDEKSLKYGLMQDTETEINDNREKRHVYSFDSQDPQQFKLRKRKIKLEQEESRDKAVEELKKGKWEGNFQKPSIADKELQNTKSERKFDETENFRTNFKYDQSKAETDQNDFQKSSNIYKPKSNLSKNIVNEAEGKKCDDLNNTSLEINKFNEAKASDLNSQNKTKISIKREVKGSSWDETKSGFRIRKQRGMPSSSRNTITRRTARPMISKKKLVQDKDGEACYDDVSTEENEKIRPNQKPQKREIATRSYEETKSGSRDKGDLKVKLQQNNGKPKNFNITKVTTNKYKRDEMHEEDEEACIDSEEVGSNSIIDYIKPIGSFKKGKSMRIGQNSFSKDSVKGHVAIQFQPHV